MEKYIVKNISFNPHWKHYSLEVEGSEQWKSGTITQVNDKLIFRSFDVDYELSFKDERAYLKFFEALIDRYCIFEKNLCLLIDDMKSEMQDLNFTIIPTDIVTLIMNVDSCGIFERYNGLYCVHRYRGYDGVRLMYPISDELAENIRKDAISHYQSEIDRLNNLF